MEMTYHTRRNVKRGILIGVSVFLALMLVWTCWIIWMERHIVYTRDGAVVDFQLTSQDPGEGQLAYPPAEQEKVSIYYNDGEELIGLDLSLRQMKGYYITSDLLTNGDLGTIQATIAALPVGSTVMIDVKNIKGHFFYTTEITDAPISTAVDVEAVDALIDDMLSRNLYVVATAPAFRDRSYGLAHTNTGLSFEGGGGALWLDSSNCYWLDPGKSRTMDYLSKIANELRLKGFDEVMFTDFCFPDSPQILFSGDKVEAIQTAAFLLDLFRCIALHLFGL